MCDCSPEYLDCLWRLVRHKQILFPDEAVSKDEFTRTMFNSVVLTYGPGLVRLSSIVPLTRCELHGFVLNSALTPFIEPFKQMLAWAFRTLRIKRMESFIPAHARSLRRFFIACGFQKEGLLRSRRFYRGLPVDEEIYSILEGEL